MACTGIQGTRWVIAQCPHNMVEGQPRLLDVDGCRCSSVPRGFITPRLGVTVVGQLCFGQWCFKAPAALADLYGRESCACACADGDASSQVRQGEGGAAIAAEVCAEQAEECWVLADRNKLSRGHRPTTRSEVAGKPGDVADARIA